MNNDVKEKKIEIFRELSISGPSAMLADFMKVVSTRVATSEFWASVEINPSDYGGNTNCFSCVATDKHPAAKLWFALSSKEEKMYVSNIVPIDMNKLSKRQYNEILVEFYESFVYTLQTPKHLKIRLDNDYVGLNHWLDDEAIQLLNSFSNLANKSTGTGHPLDERRWWLFCFYVHKNGFFPDFYPDILIRWLNEVLGWREESAHNLGINYERTLRTLEQYDIYCRIGRLP